MTDPVCIGNATLYLGDATEIVPMLGMLDCVVTDPPFGMNFRSNHREVRWDAISGDSDLNLLQWVCGLPARFSKYIFCRWDNLPDVPKPKSLVTWVKNNWSMGDLEHEHGRQTEVVLFYPGEAHFFPTGRPNDVVKAPRSKNENHPTEKPVELMMAIVEWTAGVVVDPFMGAGSTGIAASRLGRQFIGIEINPAHFATARRRIEEAQRQADLFVPQDWQAKDSQANYELALQEMRNR